MEASASRSGQRHGATLIRREVVATIRATTARRATLPFAPGCVRAARHLSCGVRDVTIAPDALALNVQVARITRTSDATARKLRARIVRWTQDQHDQVAAVGLDTVTLPGTLNDRARNSFEPLAAIASFAGLVWVDALQVAAKRLSEDVEDTDGVGVRLPRDMRRVFKEQARDKIISVQLCELPAALDDDTAPWARWHRRAHDDHDRRVQPEDLARLLKPFGVQPLKLWLGSRTARGYRSADLADALDRYVGPEQEDADADGDAHQQTGHPEQPEHA